MLNNQGSVLFYRLSCGHPQYCFLTVGTVLQPVCWLFDGWFILPPNGGGSDLLLSPLSYISCPAALLLECLTIWAVSCLTPSPCLFGGRFPASRGRRLRPSLIPSILYLPLQSSGVRLVVLLSEGAVFHPVVSHPRWSCLSARPLRLDCLPPFDIHYPLSTLFTCFHFCYRLFPSFIFSCWLFGNAGVFYHLPAVLPPGGPSLFYIKAGGWRWLFNICAESRRYLFTRLGRQLLTCFIKQPWLFWFPAGGWTSGAFNVWGVLLRHSLPLLYALDC